MQAPAYPSALFTLGRALREAGYRFVTVTPETHRRVHARDAGPGSTLRDVFGWSRPFARDAIPSAMLELLREADALVRVGDLYESAVRFSSLGDALFVHDAYPTTRPDAVFFGPDTYRFCAAIARAGVVAERVVDVGCGSGAGGIVAARDATRVVLGDVNERALAFARVNVELAGLTGVEIVTSDVLGGVEGAIDLVVANPPYLRDELRRTYRDGGGELGEGLAVRIVKEATLRLSPGGTLLLYTGAAVASGEDLVRRAVLPLLAEAGMHARYEELDPDVFGDELDRPAYAAVERIAAVLRDGATMTWLELQRTLGRVNRWRLRPALPGDVPDAFEKEAREAHDREIAFVEGERASVAERASSAPAGPDAFVAWFEDLGKTGPGQHDPLFDWLEGTAGLEQMRWFVEQEVAGEAGFDDLVALTQVKMPARAKLELARNYWDEMGQGHESGMHGPMLGRLAEELGIAGSDGERILPEPLAQGNLLVALAVHRRYAFHSIGALGAIELTAPGRATKVNAGLRRLGVGGDARRYFALHATLDVAHSRAWNAEVIRPLVLADPRVARAIAEGALMRLTAGERCFVRYRRELGLLGLPGLPCLP